MTRCLSTGSRIIPKANFCPSLLARVHRVQSLQTSTANAGNGVTYRQFYKPTKPGSKFSGLVE